MICMQKMGTRSIALILIVLLAATACSKKKPTSLKPGKTSSKTGLAYNGKDGFEVKQYKALPAGPDLVYIEGGRFTMGSLEEDVMTRRDNPKRTVSIQSFYMDQTEVANVHYLEYLNAVQRDSSEEFYAKALPDTNVWFNELSFNDSYVTMYLRHPGFRLYPVVGVSWVQANDYCAWRTAAVSQSNNAKGAAAAGGKKKKGFSFGKKKKAEGEAVAAAADAPAPQLRIESGYVMPPYRLPTEAEFEYAAMAMIGTQYSDENQANSRIYPWDGSTMRNPRGRKQGTMLANFKRGPGDYAGIAGKSNDGAIITQEIRSYPANDNGLYDMAGNVSEWVYDVYRPLSNSDVNDLNSFRRDGYQDEAKNYDSKNNNSMVDDKLRVYKGGSWSDVAYWLSPGTRRYMDQDSATAMVGFRCAMIATGTHKE
ncbi:gliding motility-associated lipoprotein GldJ/gliding motility-associated lipoprotein GldJ,TIGR03530 [Dyadobacter soli]|uniref:Gliding motility-associated lipoprotein GldJ/gliding motility-associated lipoprotein GldJ,TIGR03530 n=3 Tax=Dyadobacter soli TaxID=659014 RepID=A0A1G7EL29_9BACT|nr:gliding motility-associated lipoprotein GldJ/gliding motility-associated lipoprotein GldJ,TIGR03530 [Dyadobacter soli]